MTSPSSSSSPLTAADFAPLIDLYNARRYTELENRVQELLVKHPNAPFAWQLLGGARQMQGKDALAAFQKVASLSPQDAGAQFNLGVAFKSAGQLEQAAKCYRQALVLNPRYLEALNNLGGVLRDLGQLDEAVQCYRQVLAIQPRSVSTLNNLGIVLKDIGQPDEAVQCYRQAIQLKPDYADAHYNLGNVFKEQKQFDQAVACYRQAVKFRPEFADAHSNWGATLKDQGQLDEALPHLQKAAELNPHSAEYQLGLGVIQYHLKQIYLSIACCQRALAINPDYAEAHNQLGLSLKANGQLENAIKSYQRAITCDPNAASAYSNLGDAQRDALQYDNALKNYHHALTLQPDWPGLHNSLAITLSELGQFAEASDSFRRALEMKPEYFEAHSSLLMASSYNDSLNTSEYLQEALRYGESVAQNATSRFGTWQCTSQPRKLRVGVVSGDLCSHPVGYFLESLLAHLDYAQIELIAYSNNHKEDDLTARIKSYFSHWRPVFTFNDSATARCIHNDGVHVLLDLSGHTAKNRLPVFAWKPAPVQCTWLGLPTTTGVAEIDYVLGDPTATPPEDADHFSEQIWRLPEIYLCLSTPNTALTVSDLPALSNHRITFGSFNNLTKMNDATVVVWARILAALPSSRLLLKAKQLKDEFIVSNTLQRFAAQGIGADRLILEEPIPSRDDHLASYQRMDIALDPFPYPGVTTSAEALWMGVPVLSMQGDRFMSRTATSIAHNAGLSDWIARDEDDYVAKAIAFAGDLPKLAALRAGLREQVRVSPLFDAPRFAKNFEAALWGMWQAKGASLVKGSKPL